jgi:hypothetical protein
VELKLNKMWVGLDHDTYSGIQGKALHQYNTTSRPTRMDMPWYWLWEHDLNNVERNKTLHFNALKVMGEKLHIEKDVCPKRLDCTWLRSIGM